MKTNTLIENALKNDYAVYATPILIADWNLNRYYLPEADNIPSEESEGYDEEYFPIESICLPNRPTGGIQKARIGASIVADDYEQSLVPRFYISHLDDVYKYWTSPYPTNASGVFPLHSDGKTTVRPHIIYSSTVNSNKIIIKMNTGWAKPGTFYVKALKNDVWTTLSTSPTIAGNGTITLYYNGTGWSSTFSTFEHTDAFDGLMIEVNTMSGGMKLDGSPMTYLDGAPGVSEVFANKTTNGRNSHFELISIEAHYTADLTDRLISVTDTIELAENSALYPVGTITTNVGEVMLSNEDGLLNTENEDSPFAGILDSNVEFTLSYEYDIKGTKTSVQQFIMYTGPWMGQRTGVVAVSLEDYSKFLQTLIPRPVMWEDLTVPQIVWRLLDSVGVVNFEIDNDDRVQSHIIPVYYIDGTKSVWEELNEIARGSQTAIYFDGYNKLQVKTRTAAFDNEAEETWNFNAEDQADKLADIVSLTQEEQLETNKVVISYQATKWSISGKGTPSLEKVWEPEDTVVLRASQLAKPLALDDAHVWIPKNDIRLWHYSGMFNLEGEIIAYDGKQYIYYTCEDGFTRHVTTVNSADEKRRCDKRTPAIFRYKNHFTGGLRIKERGVWDSEPRAHGVNASGYSVRSYINGNSKSNAKGFKHIPDKSIVELSPGPNINGSNETLMATRGATDDTPFYVYGTRMKFEKESGYGSRTAGIVIHNQGSTEDGYYIDIATTLSLDATARQKRNEVVVYTKKGGKLTSVSGNSGKGSKIAIQDKKWYDIDVFYDAIGPNNDHVLTIYINGVVADVVTISGADRANSNGKFGMYVRGQTKAAFEYLYAVKEKVPAFGEDVSWFNLVDGGYTGDFWNREWVFGWKTYHTGSGKNRKTRRKRLNGRFFDDFGPYLHEVREYDVKFDPAPVQYSRLYMTNDWSAIVMEYRANPFGAHWVVSNTIRDNAVIHGEDTLSFRQENSGVEQIMNVFGRTLNFADATTVEAKNDEGIQRRGPVEVELDSFLIQSERMAQDVADWMVEHWGEGVDLLTVQVFGNPLIEVTDIVYVDYPFYDISDPYFVVGASTTFDSGMSTTLTLRRVR